MAPLKRYLNFTHTPFMTLSETSTYNGAMILSITTLSTMTLNITIKKCGTQHNGIEHSKMLY